MAENDNLRITLIAGGLGQGGAEKQFLYMIHALQEIGAAVQVIALTKGEYHEQTLLNQGIVPVYAGASLNTRLVNIYRAVQVFRPHFLQASHFFASLYAGIVGQLTGVPSIGAIRSDLYLDLQGIGKAGPWLLRLPSAFLANSKKARENSTHFGISPDRIFLLQNVIDLEDFDRRRDSAPIELLDAGRIQVSTVARLVPVKRLERFLDGLALARRQVPTLQGVIIGGGPEEAALRAKAADLQLQPDEPLPGIRFLGERSDIPQLLAQSAMCVMTSDREGFPNVLLEAMAARLPVMATPAGDSPELINEGVSGYLIPFDDPEVLADRLVRLANSPTLRQSMGRAGRQIVEQKFNSQQLGGQMVEIYRDIAQKTRNRSALAALENKPAPRQEKVLPLS